MPSAEQREIAQSMFDRYKSPHKARTWAFDHAMDHPSGSAGRKHWFAVMNAMADLAAAQGVYLSRPADGSAGLKKKGHKNMSKCACPPKGRRARQVVKYVGGVEIARVVPRSGGVYWTVEWADKSRSFSTEAEAIAWATTHEAPKAQRFNAAAEREEQAANRYLADLERRERGGRRSSGASRAKPSSIYEYTKATPRAMKQAKLYVASGGSNAKLYRFDKTGAVVNESQNLAGMKRAVSQGWNNRGPSAVRIDVWRMGAGYNYGGKGSGGALFVHFEDGSVWGARFASYTVLQHFVSGWRNVSWLPLYVNGRSKGEAGEAFK